MRILLARRTTQVAFLLFVFLVPVFNLFRYDTATHELFLFGSAWSLGLKQGFVADHSSLGSLQVAAHFVFKAVLPWLVFLAVFPLLGYFTGRFFCGWFCPEGLFFELADYLTLQLLGRRSIYGGRANDPPVLVRHRIRAALLAMVSMILLPLAGGVALTGYLVAPATVWHQIATGHLTFGVKAGITGVAIYMLITSIFVRHVLCKFVCAAGLMQMLFGWVSRSSLRISMDTGRISACTDCKSCDRACFMNVAPRKHKRDISCVNCGACITACDKELGTGRGLFRFTRGDGQKAS